MDSQDQWVIRSVRDWLQAGSTAWFCTIVGTFGASPRPVGSLLAVNEHGELAGSLSGGCVEDDLLERLVAGRMAQGQPQVIEYGVTPEENERLGLPCGGRLHVLVERLAADAVNASQMAGILQSLEARRCMRRTVDLDTGSVETRPVTQFMPLIREAHRVTQVFGPQYQLLLVGAGELARVLAQMASMMDYRVLVCDPRSERIAQWPLADIEAVQGMPDDIIRERAADARSIIITLAHDPRIDDMALLEALQSHAFYVGALGSERTSAQRRERLLQLGITPLQLQRLHAPVGLPIHSKRPGEIAVSILAQLTALRAGEGRSGG